MARYTDYSKIPMGKNDIGAKTIGEYFEKLLLTLWDEQEDFSGKRPFGNSGWEYDVYASLISAGVVDGHLDEEGYVVDVTYSAANDIVCKMIKQIFASDADVVPKSEVDKLHEVIFKKEDLMQKIAEERNKYSDELETVKDNNEHLAVMLEETRIELEAMRGAANSLKMHYEKAEAEIERLQAEKDALIKNYAECMKDFASEIFAEIEKDIDIKISVTKEFLYKQGGRTAGKTIFQTRLNVLNELDDFFSELKKKYTEGKDDRL